MSQLHALQGTLATWAEDTSRLSVSWQDTPIGYKPQPYVLLQLNAIAAVGIDYPAIEFDEPNDKIDVVIQGLRTFTLEYIVKTFSQTPGKDAKYFLDMARMRMKFESNIQTLSDAGLSVLDTLSIVDQDYVFNERRVSQSQMDLLCSARVGVRDDVYDGAYIKSVGLTVSGTNDEGNVIVTDEFTVAVEG